jgi:hypothetical protein
MCIVIRPDRVLLSLLKMQVSPFELLTRRAAHMDVRRFQSSQDGESENGRSTRKPSEL